MSDPPTESLIALRDRREAAIQRLSDGFVSDLLPVESFEDRLARVHAATTLAQIEAVVADLQPLPAGTTSTALAPLAVNPGLAVTTTRLRALLGNVERGGGWVVPARLEVRVTFGNAELDFREARFTAPVTELAASVFCGNLEILVPPQLAVDCEGSSVLGNVENHGSGAVGDPDRPLLRIRGRAVLGNIEVHTRFPGESAQQWARRHRRAVRRLPPIGI
jgi:Domain of unknown function (DUF1707)